MLEAVDTSPVSPVCLRSCELLPWRALHGRNKISSCLKKNKQQQQDNNIRTNPPPFCWLAESLLPPTQPQLERLFITCSKATLVVTVPFSTHCSLFLPSQGAAAATTAPLFCLQGAPHLCNLQEAKGENVELMLDRVRVIFLAAEINRSSAAVSILLSISGRIKSFTQDLYLPHPQSQGKGALVLLVLLGSEVPFRPELQLVFGARLS